MNNNIFSYILILLCLLMTSCGRSKPITFYVLNPVPATHLTKHQARHVKIGISTIKAPGYLKKNQLMIHCTPQRLKLKEDHQWAEDLDKNISRVVMANLNTMLPQAMVETSPWRSDFTPTYTLQINITEFDIDVNGLSVLRATYAIYNKSELLKKRQVRYKIKVDNVTMDSLVHSMNMNLTSLTKDIAREMPKNERGK